MNGHALQALLHADVRALVRDPLLKWVALLPIGVALMLRALVPRIQEALASGMAVDLTPYHPLIMGGYLMTAPGIVGMVIGFLLLDERDARTLDALRVTPVGMEWYLTYRVVLPLVLGTAGTLIGYPLAGLAPLRVRELLAVTAVAGLSAPMLTLVLATAAPNKVAGFAVVKVTNAVNLLPIVAFFIPLPYQLAAGVLPTYWPMRALWSAASGARFMGALGAGVIVSVVALALLAGLFRRKLSS
jgi:fluoroquinolone transport system permease protein